MMMLVTLGLLLMLVFVLMALRYLMLVVVVLFVSRMLLLWHVLIRSTKMGIHMSHVVYLTCILKSVLLCLLKWMNGWSTCTSHWSIKTRVITSNHGVCLLQCLHLLKFIHEVIFD